MAHGSTLTLFLVMLNGSGELALFRSFFPLGRPTDRSNGHNNQRIPKDTTHPLDILNIRQERPILEKSRIVAFFEIGEPNEYRLGDRHVEIYPELSFPYSLRLGCETIAKSVAVCTPRRGNFMGRIHRVPRRLDFFGSQTADRIPTPVVHGRGGHRTL